MNATTLLSTNTCQEVIRRVSNNNGQLLNNRTVLSIADHYAESREIYSVMPKVRIATKEIFVIEHHPYRGTQNPYNGVYNYTEERERIVGVQQRVDPDSFSFCQELAELIKRVKQKAKEAAIQKQREREQKLQSQDVDHWNRALKLQREKNYNRAISEVNQIRSQGSNPKVTCREKNDLLRELRNQKERAEKEAVWRAIEAKERAQRDYERAVSDYKEKYRNYQDSCAWNQLEDSLYFVQNNKWAMFGKKGQVHVERRRTEFEIQQERNACPTNPSSRPRPQYYSSTPPNTNRVNNRPPPLLSRRGDKTPQKNTRPLQDHEKHIWGSIWSHFQKVYDYRYCSLTGTLENAKKAFQSFRGKTEYLNKSLTILGQKYNVASLFQDPTPFEKLRQQLLSREQQETKGPKEEMERVVKEHDGPLLAARKKHKEKLEEIPKIREKILKDFEFEKLCANALKFHIMPHNELQAIAAFRHIYQQQAPFLDTSTMQTLIKSNKIRSFSEIRRDAFQNQRSESLSLRILRENFDLFNQILYSPCFVFVQCDSGKMPVIKLLSTFKEDSVAKKYLSWYEALAKKPFCVDSRPFIQSFIKHFKEDYEKETLVSPFYNMIDLIKEDKLFSYEQIWCYAQANRTSRTYQVLDFEFKGEYRKNFLWQMYDRLLREQQKLNLCTIETKPYTIVRENKPEQFYEGEMLKSLAVDTIHTFSEITTTYTPNRYGMKTLELQDSKSVRLDSNISATEKNLWNGYYSYIANQKKSKPGISIVQVPNPAEQKAAYAFKEIFNLYYDLSFFPADLRMKRMLEKGEMKALEQIQCYAKKYPDSMTSEILEKNSGVISGNYNLSVHKVGSHRMLFFTSSGTRKKLTIDEFMDLVIKKTGKQMFTKNNIVKYFSPLIASIQKGEISGILVYSTLFSKEKPYYYFHFPMQSFSDFRTRSTITSGLASLHTPVFQNSLQRNVLFDNKIK